MPRVKMAVARERRARVLALLCERGALDGGALLSIPAIARLANLTKCQARSVVRSLKEAGYVRIEPRFLPNGGSAKNAYTVTPKGRDASEAGRSSLADRPRTAD